MPPTATRGSIPTGRCGDTAGLVLTLPPSALPASGTHNLSTSDLCQTCQIGLESALVGGSGAGTPGTPSPHGHTAPPSPAAASRPRCLPQPPAGAQEVLGAILRHCFFCCFFSFFFFPSTIRKGLKKAGLEPPPLTILVPRGHRARLTLGCYQEVPAPPTTTAGHRPDPGTPSAPWG